MKRHTARASRSHTTKTRKSGVKMSDTDKAYLSEYMSDPKFKLTKVLHGKKAVDVASKKFYPNDMKEGKKWAKQYSSNIKSTAKLYIIKLGPDKTAYKFLIAGSK